MTDRPSKTLANLSQDWPDDPANGDLARLGQDLFANRPELSQLALDRIQIRMREAMNRPGSQRRWRTLFALFVAVAALSGGIYAWIATSKPHPSASENNAAKEIVEDRYQITLPSSSPKAGEKPLIDLQRDNDLFKHDAKEPKK